STAAPIRPTEQRRRWSWRGRKNLREVARAVGCVVERRGWERRGLEEAEV
ncbi:unnamed protein product, partial [Musa textilis]